MTSFVGVNRRGRAVVGQLGPRVDVAAWVEGRYRARWRRLEVHGPDQQLGGIHRSEDTGRRVWWAQLSASIPDTDPVKESPT